MVMMMMMMSVKIKKMLKQGCRSHTIYVNRSQLSFFNCYLPLGINQVLLQLSSLVQQSLQSTLYLSVSGIECYLPT